MARRPVILIELVRFACALAVMACHYGLGFWRLPGPHPKLLLAGIRYNSPVEAWVQFGWLGVEVFFVISGLVIMRSVDGVSAASFARLRVLRLAPAAWICATLTLVAIGVTSGSDPALWASWARSVAFWPTGTLIDGSYWTLGIELGFYAAVLLSLSTGGGARRVERVAMAIGLASVAFWLGCALAGPAGAALIGRRGLQLLLLKHGCFFALGALIARCQTDALTPLRTTMIAAMGGGALLEVAAHAIESANNTGLPRATGAALLLFAAVVAVLAWAERAQPTLERWISPEAARAIGMATYPLYLLHQDAGAALTAALVHEGATPGTALLLAAASMLALAVVVARTGEPAVRRRLAALIGPRRGATPVTAPIASHRLG